MSRYCFHADESFVNPITREFQVVRIAENESGYTPVTEHPDLGYCKDTAAAMNREHGLSDQDVSDIRTASMRQHIQETDGHGVTQRLDDDPEPEVRIAVTDMEGTVIDIIECTCQDLVDEIRRNPHGLLSGINEKLVQS